MHVTIIGTGNMARGLGRRLIAGGHDVTVLGKDTEAAEAVVTDIGAKDRATAGRSGDAIAGDVVVLAVYYPDAQSAVQDYGDGLSGKVVVDITNPVNESFDGLVTPPDGSAAEELAPKRDRCACCQGVQHHLRRNAGRGPCSRTAAGRLHRRRRRGREGNRRQAGGGRRAEPDRRRRAEARPRAGGHGSAAHDAAKCARDRLLERAQGHRMSP